MLQLDNNQVRVTDLPVVTDSSNEGYRERIYQSPTFGLLSDKVVGLELRRSQRGWSDSLWQLSLVLGRIHGARCKQEHVIRLLRASLFAFPNGAILLKRWRQIAGEGIYHQGLGAMMLNYYYGFGQIEVGFSFQEHPSMGIQVMFSGNFPEWRLYGALPSTLRPEHYFYQRSSVDD